MSHDDYIKLPRLHVHQELHENAKISLSSAQAHYLKNVLRRNEGDRLLLFNGRDGEWLAALTALGKKEAVAVPEKCLRPQPAPQGETHLIFTPIKKARLDFLIEKAVELGATHLHPLITARTEVRHINEERVQAQMIEAAEQCERLAVPRLSRPVSLAALPGSWDRAIPVYACIERRDAPQLKDCDIPDKAAFLIGPEGGFSPEEIAMIEKMPFSKPVSLGETVYRAETAALICLIAGRQHSKIYEK